MNIKNVQRVVGNPMRCIDVLTVVVLTLSMPLAGCGLLGASFDEKEKKLAPLREMKFRVGERERIEIDNVQRQIMHEGAPALFERRRENPRAMSDNVPDAIEERDRTIRQLVDNAIMRAREPGDNSAGTRQEEQ